VGMSCDDWKEQTQCPANARYSALLETVTISDAVDAYSPLFFFFSGLMFMHLHEIIFKGRVSFSVRCNAHIAIVLSYIISVIDYSLRGPLDFNFVAYQFEYIMLHIVTTIYLNYRCPHGKRSFMILRFQT